MAPDNFDKAQPELSTTIQAKRLYQAFCGTITFATVDS